MSRRLDRATAELAIAGLLVAVFTCGLVVLAALVPVGQGIAAKGGGWFTPAVVGGVFTLHPLLVAIPWAACFVLGLLDWHRPWRAEHLDLLALAGFFPVAMQLLVRIASVAEGNIADVGQASSLGASRVLHGLHLYGAVSWQGPRRAPDLPSGLLRPVRLLRVHPVRGHLPASAGSARDAGARGVLR